jgi:hypothetical protein
MRAGITLALGVLLALAAAGCGGSDDAEELAFRVYDPTGKIPVEVTTEDLVRESARGGSQGDGMAVVSIELTRAGGSRFCRLTRALARRSAESGKPQRFVVEFNDEMTARPTIDYEATPDGTCGSPAIELTGLQFAEALALVRLIRDDGEN